MYPFFCIHWRNFTTTLEEGRTRTCLLPRFSALVMERKVLFKTDMRTMIAIYQQRGQRERLKYYQLMKLTERIKQPHVKQYKAYMSHNIFNTNNIYYHNSTCVCVLRKERRKNYMCSIFSLFHQTGFQDKEKNFRVRRVKICILRPHQIFSKNGD